MVYLFNKCIFVTSKIYFMLRVTRASNCGGYLLTEDFEPFCGDNPNRPEFVLADEQLDMIMPKGIECPPGPVEAIKKYAYTKSELRRYQRLCWQLAGVLTAYLLLDAVLIIWLIRLGS